jgi:hypothetical protein
MQLILCEKDPQSFSLFFLALEETRELEKRVDKEI